MTLQFPRQIYDFTAFSQTRPTQQQPGDRLDAQFRDHAEIIASLVETMLAGQARLVGVHDLDPAVLDSFTASLNAVFTAGVANVAALAASAGDSASAATAARHSAESTLAQANEILAQINGLAPGAVALLNAESLKAQALIDHMAVLEPRLTNDENVALAAAATAEDWAQVSITWAEYLPGPIPPNILAISGVSGDHWSSRWWSNKASQSVSTIQTSEANAAASASAAATSASNAAASAANAAASYDSFDDRYLGPKPTPPTVDNDGNPLLTGALYFDTGTNAMRVWNGTVWQALPAAATGTAADVAYAPNAPQGIAATNVQAALDEVAAERLQDAPVNASQYGRSNGAWAVITYAYGALTGVPATFPPSAHSHPISDVTGLSAALTAKADQSALTTEVTNRTTADTLIRTDFAAADTSIRTDFAAADTAIRTDFAAADTSIRADVPIKAGGALSVAEIPIASAATCNIGAVASHLVLITGTVTIVNFDTAGVAGTVRFVRFSASLTLTHGANLNLPNGVNLVTGAGDTASFVCIATGVWACVGYRYQANQYAQVAQIWANSAPSPAGLMTANSEWAALVTATLTDAATIAVDLATGINFTVTLGGNRTLGNPTNTKVGQSGFISLIQDGTGTRTLAFGTNYKFAGGVDPALSTAAGALDCLFYTVLNSTFIACTFARAFA